MVESKVVNWFKSAAATGSAASAPELLCIGNFKPFLGRNFRTSDDILAAESWISKLNVEEDGL